MREHQIQNEIRARISRYGLVFRHNVGGRTGEDGRWFDTGLPRGYPDLSCVIAGLPPVFIEVKAEKGHVSEHQKRMHDALKQNGAIVLVCRSADEAEKRISELIKT